MFIFEVICFFVFDTPPSLGGRLSRSMPILIIYCNIDMTPIAS